MNKGTLAAGAACLGLGLGVLLTKPDVSASEQATTGLPQPAETKLRVKNTRQTTPHLVRTLIDPTLHLEAQIEAIRSLPADLTEEEFQALLDLIQQPSPDRQQPHRWSTLQNELMEVLRADRYAHWQGYLPSMVGLVTNIHIDPIVRDYAAQHLVLYLNDRSHQLSGEQRALGLKSLLKPLTTPRDQSSQVVGTILLALCDLHRNRPALVAPYRNQIAQATTDLLQPNRAVSFSNQISALQTAGRLQLPDLHSTVQAIAKGNPNTTQRDTLRLSAVAALGYYRDPADRPFLTELSRSNSPLRYAAQAALVRLTQ